MSAVAFYICSTISNLNYRFIELSGFQVRGTFLFSSLNPFVQLKELMGIAYLIDWFQQVYKGFTFVFIKD